MHLTSRPFWCNSAKLYPHTMAGLLVMLESMTVSANPTKLLPTAVD